METKPAEEKTTASFANDDDVKPAPAATPIEIPFAETQTSNFLTTASSFITQLTHVLSDVSATENLVKSLTRKDESTGQTYLQIPVENENVVKNAFTLLAGLFKGLGGK